VCSVDEFVDFIVLRPQQTRLGGSHATYPMSLKRPALNPLSRVTVSEFRRIPNRDEAHADPVDKYDDNTRLWHDQHLRL
jgi:hypothetical protein